MRTISGIRRDVLIRIIGIGLALLVICLIAVDQFILSSFRNLETEWAEQQISQIKNVTRGEITSLKNTLKNETRWDDAYDFVQNRNPEFIDSSMPDLNDLNIDLSLYLDTNGQLIIGQQRQQTTLSEVPISAALTENLTADSRLWSHPDPQSSLEGILIVDDTPLLFASQPILTSDGAGPVRGTMIIGRWMKTEWLTHLGRTINYPVTLKPLSAEYRQGSTAPQDGIKRTRSDELTGSIILMDINSEPAVKLEVIFPRDMYRQGVKSILLFVLFYACGIIFCIALVYYYFNTWLTSRHESRRRIKHLAYHDDLTDLPNRVFLQQFVQRTLHHTTRASETAALLFVDLDHFTQVNDTHGHATADNLLISASRWFADNLRESDLVSRIGGDMFVVFLPSMQGKDSVKRVARKLLEIKYHPFELDESQVFITCSIGISLFPEDGEDFHTLLKLADMALHEAKRTGRNNYQFASREMNSRIEEQHYLEAAISLALQRDEFSLAFQPQYDMADKKLKSVEALLRWDHPERGNIPPSVFIPIAEKTGLIFDLGHWVLKAACQQISRWKKTHDDVPTIAVNFSGLEIKSHDFIEKLERTMAEYNVKPGQIEIEMTESVLMDSIEEMQVILRKLTEKGFRIAIDDFGTGYSSLSYLRHFPIQKIKIDKSFTAGVAQSREDIAIIDAIVTIADSLGLEVIAEGVETGEQLDALLSRGCFGMQGYFFARPMAARDITDYCPFKFNQALGIPEYPQGGPASKLQPT